MIETQLWNMQVISVTSCLGHRKILAFEEYVMAISMGFGVSRNSKKKALKSVSPLSAFLISISYIIEESFIMAPGFQLLEQLRVLTQVDIDSVNVEGMVIAWIPLHQLTHMPISSGKDSWSFR